MAAPPPPTAGPDPSPNRGPQPAPAPSCCAGLRPALLNGWRQGFPMQPSPFQQVAAQCGSTLREVLLQCQRLQASGSLQPVQVRWGQALQRTHWRLGLWVHDSHQPALLKALAREPSCVRWDRVLKPGSGQPTLWADFIGRDAHALTHSIERALLGLPMQQAPMRLSLQQADEACRCAEHDGPCTDLALAQGLEDGLPLVARPYRQLAQHLGRPERKVLARLRAWQRQGSVETLALTAPWVAAHQFGAAACLPAPVPTPLLADGLLERLRTQTGVVEVQALAAAAGQPSLLWVGVRAAHDLAPGLLRAALRAVELDPPQAQLALTETSLPRGQPSLFH